MKLRKEVWFMESWLFLAAILVIAVYGKNMSLVYGTLAVMLLKLIPYGSKLFPLMQAKGMNWGVTIISAAILIPIAQGKIGFKDLVSVFASPAGIVAMVMGVLVAILSKHGIAMLSATPQITVALICGTIFGVVVLHGVAAGPIIAGGMTYVIISLFHLSL